MIAAIIGSPTVRNYAALQILLVPYKNEIAQVISGGAKGVDTLAARWAKENGKNLTEYKPDYKRYGIKAPLVRNREIVKRADIVFILWDGNSTGTIYTRAEALRQGKPIIEKQVSLSDQLGLF